MTQPDRLYSVKDCETWLSMGKPETEEGEIVNNFVRQLRDAMQENERLRDELACRPLPFGQVLADFIHSNKEPEK